jgi:hypothetical protein
VNFGTIYLTLFVVGASNRAAQTTPPKKKPHKTNEKQIFVAIVILANELGQ